LFRFETDADDEFLREIERLVTAIEMAVQEAQEEIVEETFLALREEAPVRTGRLRESISWEFFEDFGFVEVRHPAILWIESGSLPSTGAFVRWIGRRIRYGRHPGTRPHWFIRRTFYRIPGIFTRVVNRALRLVWR